MASLICIGCPQGCTLEVESGDDGAVAVRGARCRRGKEYAHSELTDPRRTISTTVVVHGGTLPLVAVRSEAPIPKRCVPDALRQVQEMVLEAPVAAKQVVVESVAGSGVAMVTTRPVDKARSTTETGQSADT